MGSSSIYAMGQGTHLPPSGLKQLNLKKSFKLGIRSLLIACSKEEFCKAFSTFDKKKQEALHQLFIQVITCLHENIEEEFESLCHETKVITTLNTAEQLVEDQTLNLLSQKKSNLLDVKQSMTSAKKDEISYLTTMLKKAVEQNHQMRTQIESLKKNSQDLSTTTDAVRKVREYFNILPGAKSGKKSGANGS